MSGLEKIYTALGGVLFRLREERGMTQLEVCDQLGVGNSWLFRIEKGISRIQIHDLLQLCDVYGVDVSDVFRMIKSLPPAEIVVGGKTYRLVG